MDTNTVRRQSFGCRTRSGWVSDGSLRFAAEFTETASAASGGMIALLAAR